MKKYLIKSFEKFKNDALSNVIYDILKWLIPATLLFAATKLVEHSFFTNFIFERFEISYYIFILYSLCLFISSTVVVRLVFKKKYKELQIDNFTDELTGLKNYKALKQYLTEKIDEFKNSTKTLSLIIIDVDDFKVLNTNVGFNTADKILKKVGELLSNDKRATDETFRHFLRGDEFLVVASETNLNGALLAAERKRKLIQNSIFMVENIQYQLTVSCGVTEFNKKEDDFSKLTDRVIAALNQAKKQNGKNCTKSII